MNVYDSAQRVADEIIGAGGNAEDVRLWNRAWLELGEFCDCEAGRTDDYTRDLILCWVGWVMNASDRTSNLIYNAVSGFNLTIRDDECGVVGTTWLYEGIDRHTTDPARMYRELAKEQHARMAAKERKRSKAIVKAEAPGEIVLADDTPNIEEDSELVE